MPAVGASVVSFAGGAQLERESGVHLAQPCLRALVGSSPSMCRLRGAIAKIARRDAPVLVVGERGTGKELVAEALHQHGRGEHPFYPVSCAAFSPQLIDADLFGHIRGAFTGAATDRLGAFEAVGAGTLFLDELGRLPLDAQGKLLRVVETRRYRRIGETKEREFLGRIVTRPTSRSG